MGLTLVIAETIYKIWLLPPSWLLLETSLLILAVWDIVVQKIKSRLVEIVKYRRAAWNARLWDKVKQVFWAHDTFHHIVYILS